MDFLWQIPYEANFKRTLPLSVMSDFKWNVFNVFLVPESLRTDAENHFLDMGCLMLRPRSVSKDPGGCCLLPPVRLNSQRALRNGDIFGGCARLIQAEDFFKG